LKKIWLVEERISDKERELVFCLILPENYLECETACSPTREPARYFDFKIALANSLGCSAWIFISDKFFKLWR